MKTHTLATKASPTQATAAPTRGSATHVVIFLNGLFVCFLGVFQLIPLAIELAYGNQWFAFFVSGFIAIALGGGTMLATPLRSVSLDLQQAFGLTVTVWLTLVLFASLPFLFADTQLTPVDAFFESMSGLTTTGATVMTGLDTTAPGILIWRALLQWIGGVGIILTAIAILPALGVGGMQLFLTQQTGPTEKALPRASHVAIGTISIYVAITMSCAIAYNVAGMSALDSWAHAMTTAATGGFSTHDASLGYYASPTIRWIAVGFMMLSCLPYGVYLSMVHGSLMTVLRDEQVRGFLIMWLVACIALWTAHTVHLANAPDQDEVLLDVVFHVTSIITTTGYATSDFSAWGGYAVGAFFLLGFCGGCAGSSTCAVKTFRWQLLARAWWRHLRLLYRPRAVLPIRYNGKPVDVLALADIFHFICLFIVFTMIGALALTLMGLDPLTALSGSAAAITNVGPGLGPIIGPAGTYTSLPDGAKWLLAGWMLLGRLELVTLLVMCTPAFWRQWHHEDSRWKR